MCQKNVVTHKTCWCANLATTIIVGKISQKKVVGQYDCADVLCSCGYWLLFRKGINTEYWPLLWRMSQSVSQWLAWWFISHRWAKQRSVFCPSSCLVLSSKLSLRLKDPLASQSRSCWRRLAEQSGELEDQCTILSGAEGAAARSPAPSLHPLANQLYLHYLCLRHLNLLEQHHLTISCADTPSDGAVEASTGAAPSLHRMKRESRSSGPELFKLVSIARYSSCDQVLLLLTINSSHLLCDLFMSFTHSLNRWWVKAVFWKCRAREKAPLYSERTSHTTNQIKEGWDI